MHLRKPMSLMALLALLTVGPLYGQTEDGTTVNKQVRDGFWIEFGLGYSTFGCEFCSDRSNEVAGEFAIGGSVGEHWLVGFQSSQSTPTQGAGNNSIGVVGLGAHYYPTLTSGFHVRGSGGISYESLGGDPAFGGIGGTFGFGYDTPRSGSFGFTPFTDVILGSIDGTSFNAFRFGVAVSWH